MIEMKQRELGCKDHVSAGTSKPTRLSASCNRDSASHSSMICIASTEDGMAGQSKVGVSGADKIGRCLHAR